MEPRPLGRLNRRAFLGWSGVAITAAAGLLRPTRPPHPHKPKPTTTTAATTTTLPATTTTGAMPTTTTQPPVTGDLDAYADRYG